MLGPEQIEGLGQEAIFPGSNIGLRYKSARRFSGSDSTESPNSNAAEPSTPSFPTVFVNRTNPFGSDVPKESPVECDEAPYGYDGTSYLFRKFKDKRLELEGLLHPDDLRPKNSRKKENIQKERRYEPNKENKLFSMVKSKHALMYGCQDSSPTSLKLGDIHETPNFAQVSRSRDTPVMRRPDFLTTGPSMYPQCEQPYYSPFYHKTKGSSNENTTFVDDNEVRPYRRIMEILLRQNNIQSPTVPEGNLYHDGETEFKNADSENWRTDIGSDDTINYSGFTTKDKFLHINDDLITENIFGLKSAVLTHPTFSNLRSKHFDSPTWSTGNSTPVPKHFEYPVCNTLSSTPVPKHFESPNWRAVSSTPVPKHFDSPNWRAVSSTPAPKHVESPNWRAVSSTPVPKQFDSPNWRAVSSTPVPKHFESPNWRALSSTPVPKHFCENTGTFDSDFVFNPSNREQLRYQGNLVSEDVITATPELFTTQDKRFYEEHQDKRMKIDELAVEEGLDSVNKGGMKKVENVEAVNERDVGNVDESKTEMHLPVHLDGKQGSGLLRLSTEDGEVTLYSDNWRIYRQYSKAVDHLQGHLKNQSQDNVSEADTIFGLYRNSIVNK